MATLRFWHPNDLPHLLRMVAASAWHIMPPSDRVLVTQKACAERAHRNLVETLRMPYGTAVVAEMDNRPVGFLLIGLQPDPRTGEPQGYMADIYVEPAYQRHGIAQQMHQLAETYCRTAGLRRISNWTHAHNQAAHRTSARHGFRVTGELLVKRLGPPAAVHPNETAR